MGVGFVLDGWEVGGLCLCRGEELRERGGWMIRDASWNASVATVNGWTAVQPSPARLENIHSNSREDAAPSVVEKDPTSSLPPPFTYSSETKFSCSFRNPTHTHTLLRREWI